MSLLNQSPILIVDQHGLVGKALAVRIQQTYLTVFVSAEKLEEPNVISVPFKQKIPKIPNNSFSHLFLMYQGERELENALPSFVRKAKDTDAQLIFITTIFHYQDKIARKLFDLYEKSLVIVLGDIFGSLSTAPNSPVNALLFQAKVQGKIDLSNDGLGLLFPVFITDAIEGIMTVVFTKAQQKQVYAVLPPHPVTELSLSHSLQKMYPLLKVDFLRNKDRSLPYQLPTAALPAMQDYDLDKRLRDINLTYTPLASWAMSSRKVTISKSSSRKPALFIVSLSLFVISLPFLLTIGSAVIGGLLLQRAEAQAVGGDISAALSSVKTASSFLKLSDQTATTLRSGMSIMGLSKEAVGFQSTIHTASELADASTQLLSSAVDLECLLGNTTPSSKASYQDSINRLKQGVSALQAIQAEDNLPLIYKDKLSKIARPLGLVSSLIDVTPTLFGFNGSKTYLILFQNNFELRPGGGFIGSYGIVRLDRGMIAELTVHDVYDADGKLKAQITPPFALRRFMGAPHWFMRDSNFSPDFPQSASQAASFLKLETNQNIDGVIGIDVTFLTSLLEATGPIKLADYGKTLTKDNFYLETQSQVENNFFPGSTQKKDFLRAAETELLKRLQEHRFSYVSLANVLINSITQKHMLFAVADTSTQKLFSINDLSGGIGEKRQADPNMFLDTVGISEANIGQNKVNYYLKRTISQDVVIDGEGIVTEQLKVIYTNESTAKNPFAGDYKAYLRLIAPFGAVLAGVQIDGDEMVTTPAVTNENLYLAKSFIAPKGIEVDQATEGGRSLYGFLVQVPQGKTREIVLSYRLEKRAPVDAQEWEYNLLVLKQPGTLSDPYSLTVHYPVAARLLNSSLPVNDLGGKLGFDSVIDQDLALSLTFTQR